MLIDTLVAMFGIVHVDDFRNVRTVAHRAGRARPLRQGPGLVPQVVLRAPRYASPKGGARLVPRPSLQVLVRRVHRPSRGGSPLPAQDVQRRRGAARRPGRARHADDFQRRLGRDATTSAVERLCAFFSSLTTAFANMTVVEFDFSIFKWEMDEFRTYLMHLSLEGIFQTKQHPILQSLEY
ncbi:unnamed protein product [Sphagnum jensenii]|uniref:Uncharacterized protein n=1 Tax=Sphagnum jensenii TaxID=128206 RepID=A0ABP0VCK2_9BRYO